MTQVKFNRRPLYNGFSHLVDDFFSDLPVLFNRANGSVPVNINDAENGYTVDIFAPGFEKSDFKVSAEKDLLTISATRSEETKKENGKELRKEFHLNSFTRTSTLMMINSVCGCSAGSEVRFFGVLEQAAKPKAIPARIGAARKRRQLSPIILLRLRFCVSLFGVCI